MRIRTESLAFVLAPSPMLPASFPALLVAIALVVVAAPGPLWAQGADTGGAPTAAQETATFAAPAAAQESAAPVFLDGQAQVVPAFADTASWIRHDLWVETEIDTDGDEAPDRVHVSVVRPGQTETQGLKVPVIYGSSPYYAGVGSASREYFWEVRHELGDVPPVRADMPSIEHRSSRPTISRAFEATWVPRGFAVVHSSAPGTGLSEGCPTVGGAPEALAPKAVIDWLNGRARGFTAPDGGEEVVAHWSTGKVGMTGTSYNGTIPVAAATTGVDGLEAIIPVAPNTSYYRYYRSHGLVRSPGGYIGEDIDVLYDFINSGDPERRAYCNATYRDGEMATGMDRLTGDFNSFWADRDFMTRADGIRAALLMSHAFNDWNVMPEHSVEVYEAVRANGVPAMAYFHQGGHGGAPPLRLMNRWFTRYLYGVENGVEDSPRAWIVREGAERDEPTPYVDYPNPDAAPVTLRPTAGGRGTGGLVTGTSDPAGQTGGTETLVDNFSFSGGTLAAAEWSDHRLLYATEPLAAPLHISGAPRVTVRLAANRPAANLSVWLVALPWVDEPDAITDNIITRGWADPQNHPTLTGRLPVGESGGPAVGPAGHGADAHGADAHTRLTRSEPLEPGRFYELTFPLQPDDQLLPAGTRIGLMIFSSDREFTLRPEPGAELTVDLDGTSLVLPVVGGRAALERALGR